MVWIEVIGGILSAIWSGTVAVAQGVYNVLRTLFDWFLHLWTMFVEVAPTPLKIIVFLFLTLFLANGIVGTYLGLNFVCDANNNLYQPNTIFDSVRGLFTVSYQYEGNSTLQINDFIANHTTRVAQYDVGKAEAISSVSCVSNAPRWLLFGAFDILSYKTWVILLLIGGLIGLMSKFSMWTQDVRVTK